MTEQQWRRRWDASRMFLTADGESGQPGLVRRPPDDPVQHPHYAAFAATGAILPTTSVFCSSA
jgi:hypothetical protein